MDERPNDQARERVPRIQRERARVDKVTSQGRVEVIAQEEEEAIVPRLLPGRNARAPFEERVGQFHEDVCEPQRASQHQRVGLEKRGVHLARRHAQDRLRQDDARHAQRRHHDEPTDRLVAPEPAGMDGHGQGLEKPESDDDHVPHAREHDGQDEHEGV